MIPGPPNAAWEGEAFFLLLQIKGEEEAILFS